MRWKCRNRLTYNSRQRPSADGRIAAGYEFLFWLLPPAQLDPEPPVVLHRPWQNECLLSSPEAAFRTPLNGGIEESCCVMRNALYLGRDQVFSA
jgi:hypothetical protein